MKRIGLLMMLFLMSLLAIACGSETSGGEVINGLKPSDVPVKYIQARIQHDAKTMNDLLFEKTEFDPNAMPPKNNLQLQNYQLTEWKFDNVTYYYIMEYIDPENKKLHKEDFRVIKTEDGWKKDDYGDTPNFEQIVSNLEKNKTILRELSAQ